MSLLSGCQKRCHSEPVRTLLRAKSRLRRLRSVHACGRSGVGIPRIFKHFIQKSEHFSSI